MSVSQRANKVKPTAVSESLADHLLEISIEKWSAGAPIEEIRLKRYRGEVPYDENHVSLFDNFRWTGTSEELRELSKEIVGWSKPNGETRGLGALAFMAEVTGFKPRPYQRDIIMRLYDNRRLCVRSPRGAGKSAVAGNIVIHFLACNDPCKIVTTAGSWAQLERFLWPEIRLWVSKADWTLLGFKPKTNLLDMRLGGSDDGTEISNQEAFAIRSDEPEKMEGAHSSNVLFLLDEAKVIEAETFDAIEGTLSHAGAFALAISTPGAPIGRFYDIQSRNSKYADWDVMHITHQQQVDALEGDEKAAKIAWAAARKAQWGEQSPMYKNHVLGEFADTGDESIISLDNVKLAVARWIVWRDAGFPETVEAVKSPKVRAVGADIAGQGKDKTCLAFRIGRGCKKLEYKHRADPMETADKLMKLAPDWPNIKIEVDGMGSGIYSRCRQVKREKPEEYEQVNIEGVIAGSKSTKKDKSGELGFINKRAELWWTMREMLEPDSGYDIMLPDDPNLIEDLTTPKWELKEQQVGDAKSRIKVESKEDIAKRINRSTDAADAVIIVMCSDGAPIVTERIKVDAAASSPPGSTFYAVEAPRQWPRWFKGR